MTHISCHNKNSQPHDQRHEEYIFREQPSHHRQRGMKIELDFVSSHFVQSLIRMNHIFFLSRVVVCRIFINSSALHLSQITCMAPHTHTHIALFNPIYLYRPILTIPKTATAKICPHRRSCLFSRQWLFISLSANGSR